MSFSVIHKMSITNLSVMISNHYTKVYTLHGNEMISFMNSKVAKELLDYEKVPDHETRYIIKSWIEVHPYNEEYKDSVIVETHRPNGFSDYEENKVATHRISNMMIIPKDHALIVSCIPVARNHP
jgi:hypothetical protein